MGTSFRDFAEVFFELSDYVLFSTFVGLLPVRVFPFFTFLSEPVSRAGGVQTKLLHPFHSFLVSSFCLPAISPIFHCKNSPHNAFVFGSLLAADLCLPIHSPVFICITPLSLSLSLSVCLSVSVSDPSYNSTAWLGIKHQVTSHFLWPFFSQVLFGVILFCFV